MDELKKLRAVISDVDEDKNGTEGVKENYMKQKSKAKKLEDDNKRLRKLLKTQLQNAENLRTET